MRLGEARPPCNIQARCPVFTRTEGRSPIRHATAHPMHELAQGRDAILERALAILTGS